MKKKKKNRKGRANRRQGGKTRGRSRGHGARGRSGRKGAATGPQEKLSDALVDVARPILSDPGMPEDVDSFRTVLLAAGVVWNTVRDPEGAAERLRRVSEGLSADLGFPPEVAAGLIHLLLQRVRMFYPDDPRRVVDVRVREGEGEFRIQAVGVIDPPPGPEGAEEPEPMPARGTRDAGAERVCQLTITLQEVHPPVWRRVQVAEGTTLAELHRVVQAAMGWEDYHLWRFEVGGVEYEESPQGGGRRPARSAGRVRLGEVAGAGDVLLYEYDFGDSWEHRIRVEKVLPAAPGVRYPVCLAAERACPPEDSGGPWGYERLLEALADPAHPEHEEMAEWVGPGFDPEAVELEEINRRLARVRSTRGEAGREPPHGNPAEAVMREVKAQFEEVVQRVLADNPDASVEELNAALQAAPLHYNAQPQPELGGLSPAEVQRLLGADWESPESAVRLNESLPLAELEPSSTLHDVRLLLALLGEAGEVKATPKGNLPRTIVAAFRERMHWRDEWKVDWLANRKVVNEEDVFALRLTRILAKLAGLVKLRKGFFSLTRRGEQLAEEARAGELFATLFRTHFRRLNLGYLDGVEGGEVLQYTIEYTLYRFGRVGTDWRTPEALQDELVLPAVREAVPPDLYHDPLTTVLRNRFLRPMEGFGLAEVRELPKPPGTWDTPREYRKTPLFDRFLRFDLESG